MDRRRLPRGLGGGGGAGLFLFDCEGVLKGCDQNSVTKLRLKVQDGLKQGDTSSQEASWEVAEVVKGKAKRPWVRVNVDGMGRGGAGSRGEGSRASSRVGDGACRETPVSPPSWMFSADGAPGRVQPGTGQESADVSDEVV